MILILFEVYFKSKIIFFLRREYMQRVRYETTDPPEHNLAIR